MDYSAVGRQSQVVRIISFSEIIGVPNLTHALYMCDNHFHTDIISDALAIKPKYGIMSIDGNACVCGEVMGDRRKILKSFADDLPNKHRKGGQSSQRFQRLREEKRAAYIKKAAEMASTVYLRGDVPIIEGLFIAGSSVMKTVLNDHLSPKLISILQQTVTTSETGKEAWYEACDKCIPLIDGQQTAGERHLEHWFDLQNTDETRIVYGSHDTLECLRQNLVDSLIVLDTVDETLNFDEYECPKVVLKDRTETTRLFSGFGGVAGILKYRVDPIVYSGVEEQHQDINLN